MALALRVVTGTPHHLDELCPACFLPGMFAIDLHTLSDAGVGTIGTYRICEECGHRPPVAKP